MRLRSQATTVPRREALCGSTLLTRNTASRRPSIASPTSSSAPPSPYISAVSISVMPRSMPRRSAATSSARRARFSPMCQVPCPRVGIRSGMRGLLGDAQQTQEIAAPELGDLGGAVAAADQLGGEVRAVGGVVPAGEAAAAVEIRADADMAEADAADGVVDVVDVVGHGDGFGLAAGLE